MVLRIRIRFALRRNFFISRDLWIRKLVQVIDIVYIVQLLLKSSISNWFQESRGLLIILLRSLKFDFEHTVFLVGRDWVGHYFCWDSMNIILAVDIRQLQVLIQIICLIRSFRSLNVEERGRMIHISLSNCCMIVKSLTLFISRFFLPTTQMRVPIIHIGTEWAIGINAVNVFALVNDWVLHFRTCPAGNDWGRLDWGTIFEYFIEIESRSFLVFFFDLFLI